LYEIRDGRSETGIVEIKGRTIEPNQDISNVVKAAMHEALARKGFQVVQSAPVLISGEVQQWFANVRGGLPAEVESKATIYIEVYDPAIGEFIQVCIMGHLLLSTQVFLKKMCKIHWEYLCNRR
jgi:uncharacterized lipoprotein YajG